MVQRFIGAPDIIGNYWPLQAEIVFYGLIGVAIYGNFISKLMFALSLFLVFSLFSVLAYFVRYYYGVKINMEMFCGLSVISFGYCFYLWSVGIISVRWICGVSFVCAALLFLAFCLGYARDWGFNENYSRAAISYAAGVGIFLVFFRFSISHPVMAWVGLISYPLYLVHTPIFQVIKGRLPHADALLVAALSLLVSVFVSALLYYYVERPAIAMGRRLIPRLGE